MTDTTNRAGRIDELLMAIELIEDDQREKALPILRGIIRDDSDFEDAWLWMSVVVDSLDQSVVCLENVLRINPANQAAAAALYRLRAGEIANETSRNRLRFYRDIALSLFWLLVVFLLFTLMFWIFLA